MATVPCPQCSQPLELADGAGGKPVLCPECQQVFTPPATGVASGEPPVRSDADTAVTEKAPYSRNWDDPDFPQRLKRRDIAKKSSRALPIVIVVGIAAFGLFICGIPAVIFLGIVPVALFERQQADAMAGAEIGPAGAAKVVEEQVNQVAEGTANIHFDQNKDAFVFIECWENGKPSDRFKPVAQRLIGHGGEVSISIHQREHDGKNTYDIRIGDGLGPSSHLFDLPPALKHTVGPLPAEVVVKDGAAVKFCYLCVGKDCELRKNESVEDLARRAEYAFVLSLGEADKK